LIRLLDLDYLILGNNRNMTIVKLRRKYFKSELCSVVIAPQAIKFQFWADRYK